MVTTTQLSQTQTQQLLDSIESGSSPSYFAEYLLSSSEEVEIDMNKYPGLTFYYVVQMGGSQQRVATVWRSREFYLRDGERLRTALQAPSMLTQGFVARFAIPGKPIWRRVRWYNLLLAVVGVLGLVEALGNHFDWVFGEPNLSMTWNKARVHLTEGDEFTETMTLENNFPFAHRNVALTGTLTSAGSTPPHVVQLKVSPKFIAQMGGSSKHEIILSGIAPQHGNHEMVLKVSAQAGQLRWPHNFNSPQPVTVWPKKPAGKLSVESVQEQIALLHGELVVGPAAPNGLACELEFKHISGLRYEKLFAFRGLRNAEFLSTDSPTKEVAKLRWDVQPVGERVTIPFKVAFSRDGATDWKQVAERAVVRCIYQEKPQ